MTDQSNTADLPQKGLTLKEWHELLGGNYSELANQIPCSQPYPGMIANGKAFPSWKMACRIEQLTGGLVPRTNWYPADHEPIGIDDTAIIDVLDEIK